MKIGLLVAFVAMAALTSCSQVAELVADAVFVDYPYLEEPLGSVWERADRFSYLSETGDYWKSPREFERDGGGDCEDFVAWMVYHLGRGASCVRVKWLRGETHALVLYGGRYLSAQICGREYEGEDLEVVSVMSYDAVMKASTLLSTK